MTKNEKIIIYQVLPRLFGNDNSNNIPNGSIEENGCGKLAAFSEKALKEIKKMGFNYIWYTGLLEHATQTDYSSFRIRKDHSAIVKGKAGSPYAIKDYYDIDPDLAEDVSNRMNEFENLVERTHNADLKVLIDFVPNHVAREYHSDAKPTKIASLGFSDNTHTSFTPNNNFYYIPGQNFQPDFDIADYREFPAKVTGNDCFSAHPNRNDWYETIKLNYGVDYLNGGQTHFVPIPNTWKKMLDILLFWGKKKIDGFRCDMAEMVPVEFWAWVIPQVKEKYPNILFIAEVYNPQQYRNYLHQGKFDYLYDKVGLYDTLRAIVTGNQSAKAITNCWQSVDDIQANMLNFLENHDEQRIASDFFAQNPKKALPALVVSASMNKNPFMIYFGQELGESGMDQEGFSGLDGKTTIFDYWSISSIRNWRNKKLSKEQKELRSEYLHILQLCNKSKAIREGKFYDLMYVNPPSEHFNPDKQYAYLRCFEDELLLIVANFDEHDVDVEVFIPDHAFEYFELNKKTYSYSVQIKAHNATIVKISLKN
jgi:glycosidase